MLDSDTMLPLLWTHTKGWYGRYTTWIAMGFEDGSYVGYDMVRSVSALSNLSNRDVTLCARLLCCRSLHTQVHT